MIAMAGLALMRNVISFTSAGRLARQIWGNTMRQKATLPVKPMADAASSCPRGKSMIAARQISALNAAVLSVTAITAADNGSSDTPMAGGPKKINMVKG